MHRKKVKERREKMRRILVTSSHISFPFWRGRLAKGNIRKKRKVKNQNKNGERRKNSYKRRRKGRK